MPILDDAIYQPTASDGARQIKQALHNAFHQMEQSLVVVRATIDQYGKAEIAQALGPDAAELKQVYNKIKAAVVDLDNSRQVPDLPD